MVWLKALGLILVVTFVLGSAGLGVYFLRETRRFLRGAICIGGEVIEKESEWQEVAGGTEGGTSRERVLLHFIVVGCQDATGERRIVRCWVGGDGSNYRTGDRVRVWYDPGKPDDVRLDSFHSLYSPAVAAFAVAGIGLVFMVVFYCLFF